MAVGEELCINYGNDWCESAAYGPTSVTLIVIVGDNNRKWYLYTSFRIHPDIVVCAQKDILEPLSSQVIAGAQRTKQLIRPPTKLNQLLELQGPNDASR